MKGRGELDARIALRLPQAVAQAWKAAAQAAGLSLSDWVRSQVQVSGQGAVVTHLPTPQKVPKRRGHVAADPALVREIARIGNNLNQVARVLHTERAQGREAFAQAELLVVLKGIEEQLEAVLAQCTSSS